MKLGEICLISSLAKDVFPVDWAVGLQDIIAGGESITEEDEKEKFTVLNIDLATDGIKSGSLHEDIKFHCKTEHIREFKEEMLTEDEFYLLLTGEVVKKEESAECYLGVKNMHARD